MELGEVDRVRVSICKTQISGWTWMYGIELEVVVGVRGGV